MRRLHRLRHLLLFAVLTTAGPAKTPHSVGALSVRGKEAVPVETAV